MVMLTRPTCWTRRRWPQWRCTIPHGRQIRAKVCQPAALRGSPHLSGAAWSCRLSSRSGDCDVGHNASLVVVHVAKPAADTLDLFDDSVEALGAGIGDLLGQRDGDGGPPGLDGGGPAGGFVHRVSGSGVVEAPQPVARSEE